MKKLTLQKFMEYISKWHCCTFQRYELTTLVKSIINRSAVIKNSKANSLTLPQLKAKTQLPNCFKSPKQRLFTKAHLNQCAFWHNIDNITLHATSKKLVSHMEYICVFNLALCCFGNQTPQMIKSKKSIAAYKVMKHTLTGTCSQLRKTKQRNFSYKWFFLAAELQSIALALKKVPTVIETLFLRRSRNGPCNEKQAATGDSRLFFQTKAAMYRDLSSIKQNMVSERVDPWIRKRCSCGRCMVCVARSRTTLGTYIGRSEGETDGARRSEPYVKKMRFELSTKNQKPKTFKCALRSSSSHIGKPAQIVNCSGLGINNVFIMPELDRLDYATFSQMPGLDVTFYYKANRDS